MHMRDTYGLPLGDSAHFIRAIIESVVMPKKKFGKSCLSFRFQFFKPKHQNSLTFNEFIFA